MSCPTEWNLRVGLPNFVPAKIPVINSMLISRLYMGSHSSTYQKNLYLMIPAETMGTVQVDLWIRKQLKQGEPLKHNLFCTEVKYLQDLF